MRTLEFSSVRDEYEQTFGQQPPESLFSTASKLTLEDLINVAVRNSREYQTQKEILYRAALRLSLERFDYQLKFTPVGNGTRVDWRHRNDVGITENSLDVESGAAVERVLATGGTLLAGFANSVLLTFNGPNGFASDVSSELFAEVTQPLLQRDIVFERLTQAERNLVYAEDFALAGSSVQKILHRRLGDGSSEHLSQREQNLPRQPSPFPLHLSRGSSSR